MVIPRVHTVDSLHEGFIQKFSFTICQNHMDIFAELSGDINPLHTNSDFAKAKGFEGTVVYGALLVAKVSQMIGMFIPGRDALWNNLKISYINPLMIDQEAEIMAEVVHISRATASIDLKFSINSNAKTIAKGVAGVMIYLNNGANI